MGRPLDKLADTLASIAVAEEAILSHTPATCEACAEAISSRRYLVCGEERDWTNMLGSLLNDARPMVAAALAEDPLVFNEDENDLLAAAAPMLDSYRKVFAHNCPECMGGTWCPAFIGLRTAARTAAEPVQRLGSRILARV